jgi:hypothetical protein
MKSIPYTGNFHYHQRFADIKEIQHIPDKGGISST